MVRLNLAVTLLFVGHASVNGFTSKTKTKADFVATMRKLVKDENLQIQQSERMQRLTKKIVSKSKSLRNVEEVEYDDAEAVEEAEEAVEEAEETEYYAQEAEEAAEEAEYYAEEAEEAAEEEEEAAEEGDEEEANYYAQEVEYYSNEAEESQESEEYYAQEATEEESGSNSSSSSSSKHVKSWGKDDDFDFSDMTVFDVSQYSLKFHSCRALTSFDIEDLSNEDGEEAEREMEKEEGAGYPYTAEPMVNYRLCPTSTCQDDTWKGCRNVFGNYMIPLEDYFAATQEHLEEETEEYCDYCKQCAYFYKYFNAQCEFYDECETYASVCASNDDDAAVEEEIDYEQFLECTAVDKASYEQYYEAAEEEAEQEQEVAYESGYGNRRVEQEEYYDDKLYLKVFCDGSIKIGIFSDNECTNYIGHTTTIAEATGMDMAEDDLTSDLLQQNCVSCSKNNNKYFVVNQETAEERENADDDGDEDDIYDICQTMYEDSAKCNAFIPHTTTYYDEEEWSETKDVTTCAFLEAVSKGNIDKYGFVHLSKNSYFGEYINKVNNDFLPEGYYLTDSQFFAVVMASIGCLGLAAYGMYTKPAEPTISGTDLKATLV